MAASEADVCNIALLRTGHRQTIDSLVEATAEAQACKALWADARDAVLASSWWGFARRDVVLALLSGVTRSNWTYAYSLPGDCLAPRYLDPGTRSPADSARLPFAVVGDAAYGRILVTDKASAELVYTSRVTAVALFPPLFVDALAWRLAADLAAALSLKPQVAQAMEAKYGAALAQARAADVNAEQPDAPPDAEAIRARS